MTPRSPDPEASLHPTRQQLDDLDALLQRMLALPVNAEEETPGDCGGAPVDPQADPGPEPAESAGPSASPGLPFPDQLVVPPGNMIVPEPVPFPDAVLPIPGMPGIAPDGLAAGESLPLPLLNPVPPEDRRGPILPAVEPRRFPHAPSLPARPGRLPLGLRPLVWSNRVFDRFTFALGGLGRWLRRPAGRALLGVSGLLLVAAAVALVVLNRIGWTW